MTESMLNTVLWLALNIYHEARGEPIEGQKAVAKVTLTRAVEKGQSIEQVIWAKRQFSWTEDQFPDYPKDYRIFFRCCAAAEAALNEFINGDTLQRANHYHADYVSPGWAGGMKFICQIGQHKFYRG
ncbi:MAG: cell wall hydrolase [Candidatus Omnitrophica bacterium]|nr:cell wall hydrolase [Candidatus Omnitrophota bacterium]